MDSQRYLARVSVDAVRDSNMFNESVAEGILVAVLDGSDLYASRFGSGLSHSKEQLHYRVCRRIATSLGGRMVERSDERQHFCDAAIALFFGTQATNQALSAGLWIHRYLATWNQEHELSWEHQVHTRIGVSVEWSEAVELAKQAHRQEILIGGSLSRTLDEYDFMLLRSAGKLRRGASSADWAAFEQKEIADDCGENLEPELLAELESTMRKRRLSHTSQSAKYAGTTERT
jgi:hypothetical protein